MHFAALVITMIIYGLLAISYFGWGKVAVGLLNVGSNEQHSTSLNIWIGWSMSLFIFQMIYFLLPLTAVTVLPVFLLGTIFSFSNIIAIIKNIAKKSARRELFTWGTICLFILISISWIASKAMLNPINYDSGLYHFNKIRWINEYSIVPGLGNLHGRLAFNQSYFHYVASLNFYPLFNHGRSLANSFLVVLIIVTFVDLLRNVIARPMAVLEEHPFKYLSIILIFPVIGFLAVESNGLASPSPDLASTILQIIMAVVLLRSVAEWNSAKSQNAYGAVFLFILATTSITIRLSNLGFALSIIAISLFYAIRMKTTRVALNALAFCGVILFVWCSQSVILSGAPLYPSTIGYIPTEWAVPMEKVADEANWIYSWARNPKQHWSNVLGNGDWFTGWVNRLSTDVVKYPIFASAIFLVIMTGSVFIRKKRKKIIYECVILLPSIAGAIYWFVLAPDERFAHAIFFVLSMCSACLLLIALQDVCKLSDYYYMVCLVFVFANLHYLGIYGWGMKFVSTSGWYQIKEVPLISRATASGLVVFTPETGDQSWDSPLPSTPYFNPGLRLRDPNDLSSGFTVAPK